MSNSNKRIYFCLYFHLWKYWVFLCVWVSVYGCSHTLQRALFYVSKCVLVCCGWCWLPEADHHLLSQRLVFAHLSAFVEVVWAPSGLPHRRSMPDPVIQLSICVIDFFFSFLFSPPLCRVSSFLHFSVERWRGRECEKGGASEGAEHRSERWGWEGGGMERWRSGAAVGLLSVGV